MAAAGADARAAAGPERVSTIPRLTFAGPALEGSAVVWGERYRDGFLGVARKRPGGPVEILRRVPPSAELRRGFSSGLGPLSASPDWIVHTVDDAFFASPGGDGDVPRFQFNVRAFGARAGAPFRDLLPQCGDASGIATASAGDAVALAQTTTICAGRFGSRVWLIEGEAPARLFYEARLVAGQDAPGLLQVRMAGPYVAWSEGDTYVDPRKIVVARRDTGAVVARLDPSDFAGGRVFGSFDVDAAGNVAALSGSRPRCRPACVTVRSVVSGRRRTISRRASGTSIATAGGRVAYVATARERQPRRVVLATLGGRVVRRFDRFGRTRRHQGELALTSSRLAWAVRRASDVVPGGSGSIRTVELE